MSTPTSVSRAAGLALTKALSKELGLDNIRVNKMVHDGLLTITAVGQHVAQHGHVVVGPGQPGRLGLAQP
jgi:hypothetical protein